ncbi:MAG: glycosyltransferase family 2 protein [Acidobacteria bacterium]|nr:glycosyltransferase family 2 protein [Acidobacteriota bacterium]
MKPLVSILIPAYNAEAHLADTLRSAISQTWDRKEIIVVDDESTDETLSVARAFESQGVRVLKQHHQGAATARNNAFNECSGEYIQWLDADDLLAPDKIARQLKAVADTDQPRVLLSGEWARFLHRPDSAKFTPGELWCDLAADEWLMRKMENNTFMQTATWLVSRELTEAAGPWNHRLLSDDDGEYFCRVLMASRGVRFVAGSRVFYRYSRSGNLGFIGTSDSKREAMWLSMKLHIGYLRSLADTARGRAACITYLQNCLGLFYPERTDLISMAEKLAIELGGRLEKPKLPRKYRWADAMLGPRTAWKMQRDFSGFKWWVLGGWDWFLSALSSSKPEWAPLATSRNCVGMKRSNEVLVRSAH